MIALHARSPHAFRNIIHLDDITPRVGEHVFITGSTGSGKTTLECVLLENVVRLNPALTVYIIDQKRRFAAVQARDEQEQNGPIFPDGYEPIVIDKRLAVPVIARYFVRTPIHRVRPGVVIVRNEEDHRWLFEFLYRQQDVQRPVLLVFDEPTDPESSGRADPGVRRLLREGREIGVNVWAGEQRPRNMDRLYITQATRLYVGYLSPDDREYVAREAGDIRLEEPVQRYAFWMFDRTGRLEYFTLVMRSR